MKQLLVFFLIVCGLFLSSCAEKPAPEAPQINIPEPTSEVKSQILFKADENRVLSVKLNSQPIETSLGFVRLAGVIVGDELSAIVEMNGVGSIVKAGDSIQNYRVSSISAQGVVLCKKD